MAFIGHKSPRCCYVLDLQQKDSYTCCYLPCIYLAVDFLLFHEEYVYIVYSK